MSNYLGLVQSDRYVRYFDSFGSVLLWNCYFRQEQMQRVESIYRRQLSVPLLGENLWISIKSRPKVAATKGIHGSGEEFNLW